MPETVRRPFAMACIAAEVAVLVAFRPILVPGAAAAALTVPACRYADVISADASYDAWATTIVDTTLRLPAGYVPPDLVPVGQAGLPGESLVRRLAIPDLTALAGAAVAAGAPLSVISAYRSEASQAQVFATWEGLSGHAAALLASARPGHSEHQLGTAIDFTTPDATGPWAGDFAASPQGRWLRTHAWRYGFLESYPAGGSPSLTCYQAEPWHYRYAGRGLAATVHASGEPLRVYLYEHAAVGSRSTTSSASPGASSPPPAGASATALAATALGATPAGRSSGSRSVTVAVAASGGVALPELLAGIVAGLLLGRIWGLFAHRRPERRPRWPAADGRETAGAMAVRRDRRGEDRRPPTASRTEPSTRR